MRALEKATNRCFDAVQTVQTVKFALRVNEAQFHTASQIRIIIRKICKQAKTHALYRPHIVGK
jgi:hypothetical protein